MTDLTLAFTAHSETHVTGPTIQSAVAALTAARAQGISAEVLIGFDAATEECRHFVLEGFAAMGCDVTARDFNFGDPGATRNALVGMAQGHFLAFLDADDLFSENWLAEGIATLRAEEQAGHSVIAHPELNWQFDGVASVRVNTAQDDPFFSPYVFAIINYYDALCMASTQAWRDVPYPHSDINRGFGHEDYQWAIEVAAAGWRHVVVRDTIIFKRRRASSQLQKNKSANALIRQTKAMQINQIARMGESGA